MSDERVMLLRLSCARAVNEDQVVVEATGKLTRDGHEAPRPRGYERAKRLTTTIVYLLLRGILAVNDERLDECEV